MAISIQCNDSMKGCQHGSNSTNNLRLKCERFINLQPLILLFLFLCTNSRARGGNGFTAENIIFDEARTQRDPQACGIVFQLGITSNIKPC